MDKIILGRGEGKTFELIKRSYETNTYILTLNRKRADILFRQAHESGYNILYPVTVEDYFGTKFRGTFIKHILIDDADDVLQQIFNTVVIDAITMTK